MTEILEKTGKIMFSETTRYVLGAFLLLVSFTSFLFSFIAGLLFLLAAIITIPSSASLVEKKINVSMPGIAEFFIVFLLVAIAFAAFPAFPATPTAVNNTTNNTEIIATSPSAINNSEVVTVPAEQTQTETKNEAQTPATTKTPTATPAQAPTPTLDNKGKLEIFTSPAGATITIDGVSEGVSPIEGLSVDAGIHSVVVYLSGYDPQKEKVEIATSETKKLFYTLVPETKQSQASTSTQKVEENNPEPVKTETQKIEASSTNYQDAQWLAAMSRNAPIIANDMTSVAEAASSSDYVSLSNYGSALYYDSVAAIEDSNMYEVSPALQPTKDEFEEALYDSRDDGSNIVSGIYELNQGRTDESIKYLTLAADNTDECQRHTETATRLLDEYTSNL